METRQGRTERGSAILSILFKEGDRCFIKISDILGKNMHFSDRQLQIQGRLWALEIYILILNFFEVRDFFSLFS